MKMLFILTLAFITQHLIAQDIRAAFITHKWIGSQPFVYTFSITVNLFTDASMNISRPTVTVAFGDNSTGTLSLTSTSTVNGITQKQYSGTHAYPGPGDYTLHFLDTFRVGGIKNLTNSSTRAIYSGAKMSIHSYNLMNNGFFVNNTFALGVDNDKVTYNPMCVDPEGDSLSYSLVNCDITDYYIPNNAIINNATGTITFSKDSLGLYAFCFNITEWSKASTGVYNVVSSTTIDFIMEITPTVGITEWNLTQDLVYPNPSEGIVNIRYEGQVNVTNQLGQTVLATSGPDVEISKLPAGVYYLRFGNSVAKVLKQ